MEGRTFLSIVHTEGLSLWQHIISASQFDRQAIERLFLIADQFGRAIPSVQQLLAGRIMGTLFYEPSTRTRLSFESAMLRLGGQVISTENAREVSSAVKGETLEDTIRIVEGYADVIVLRHYEEGAALRAASVSSVPIINAGDGPGEHPTQALLDLYTIQKELGSIDGKKVALVGDLAYGRTVHSLARLLTLYRDVELYLVAPDVIPMHPTVLDELKEKGVRYYETNDLQSVAKQADVLYQTRIQKERFPDKQLYRQVYGLYTITPELLEAMKQHSIIMHPLPRAGEIDAAVDEDPRAAYFRQARHGVAIRMALLALCLGAVEDGSVD